MHKVDTFYCGYIGSLVLGFIIKVDVNE